MAVIVFLGLAILCLGLFSIDIPEWVVMASVFAQFIAWVWLGVSIVRGLLLVRSYKRSKGLRCLVCWYEMLPGQTQCPECGTPWAHPTLKGSLWEIQP